MISNHPFFQNSQCRGSYLHRMVIKEEYAEGVKEVCEICGLSKFFRLIDGKFNNQEYMTYHIRQVLPDFHPYHYHERLYDPLSDKIISEYYDR